MAGFTAISFGLVTKRPIKKMSRSRILQNQDSFSTDEYRSRVIPLVDELKRRPFLRLLAGFRHNSFFSGLLMYICAEKFDAVVTVSHRPAMVYGLLNRLLAKRRTIHVAKEFFFEGAADGGRKSIKSRLYAAVYHYALCNVDVIIVNATGEIVPYARELGLPESRFIFIPWPSNIDHPTMLEGHDGSILAVGRSLRDWKTLFEAVEGLPIRCVVVASRHDMTGLRLPSNVELYCDITRDHYIKLLKRAKIFIVPLVETIRSTGQASFLEAMAYGKPVLVASVVGAMDYITDRYNGLLYKPYDVQGLRNKILELNEYTELRKVIAENGYESVIELYNKNKYAVEVLNMIDGVCSRRNSHIRAQASELPCPNRRS